MTRPTKVVGQVCNLPKTREKWQVKKLPHVQIVLLSLASLIDASVANIALQMCLLGKLACPEVFSRGL
jgi:hypothetical protein